MTNLSSACVCELVPTTVLPIVARIQLTHVKYFEEDFVREYVYIRIVVCLLEKSAMAMATKTHETNDHDGLGPPSRKSKSSPPMAEQVDDVS